MGRKTVASHRVWSGVNIGRKEAVACLLEAVSYFVTDLTECPTYGKTQKLYKIIKIINQPSPTSKEEYEDTDQDDDGRNCKHRRRESSRLPVPNENSTPTEEPSTEQPTKKRVRPFEHSYKVHRRRFQSNNPSQRCPAFEELGYCLRGDMCPMEHGVNPIVAEDVQSLSQLKLLGVQHDPVPKPVTLKDPLRPYGVLASVITAPDADVYDPDQPLWANGQSVASPNHTSAGTATAPDADVYDPDQPLWGNGQPMASPNHTSVGTATAPDADMYDPDQPLWANGQPMSYPNHTNVGTATGANTNHLSYYPDPGPSVWGRIGKTHKSHGQKEHKTKPDDMHEDPTGTDNICAGRQRASRTLYICGVPQKDNQPEALLSHFQKFGCVIDIYIPLNSEKAFVQFSKREEAEAALLAPDAIMGNRFIKVLWANHDRFSDEAGPMGYHPKPSPHMSS